MRAWRSQSRFQPHVGPRRTGGHASQRTIESLTTQHILLQPADAVTPGLTIYGGDSTWTPNSVQWYTQAGVAKWLVTQAGAHRFLTSTQWRDGSAADASVQIVPSTAAIQWGDGTNPPDVSLARTAADTLTLASGDTLKGTFQDLNANPLISTTVGAYDPGTLSVTTEHFVLQHLHLKLSGSERLSMAGTTEMILKDFAA